ncbi:YncE family protein [Methanosarcina barkeri]|uniref:YncE family protein n=1 Tax=Methanosarcina barkeri TaxID=2208 RepID=UPI0009B942CB
MTLQPTLLQSPLRVGNNPYGVAVSPDGKNVYLANRKGNSVSVINATTNTS